MITITTTAVVRATKHVITLAPTPGNLAGTAWAFRSCVMSHPTALMAAIERGAPRALGTRIPASVRTILPTNPRSSTAANALKQVMMCLRKGTCIANIFANVAQTAVLTAKVARE